MTDEHALRERAYFIWQNAGGAGSPEAHWTQAVSDARAAHPVATQAVKPVRAPRAKAPAAVIAKPKAVKVAKATRTKSDTGAALH